ncbi:MAG: hypothetical protein R3D00_27370 [Bacteroidia bacterium]
MKNIIEILLAFCLVFIGACKGEKVILVNGDEDKDEAADSTSIGIPISPMLVGTNVWYIDPSDLVWNLTAQCGVSSIRIGGNSYNQNMPSKSKLLNWVTRIQAMGAEPIMQVSQVASAADAAELVRYFNIELASGKPIKYWNIGNEPWLFFNRPNTATVAAMVEPYFKERAAAMKLVDPEIKIYGPDFAYYIEDAIDQLFGGTHNIAGKVPGKDYYYCDGISWHNYPQDGSMDLAYAGIDHFEQAIIKCKKKVDDVNNRLARTGDDALGWGIGEFNAKDGARVHTWKNGQMFGGILNLCMKYGATYATTWSMFENGGSRTGTDFSFIDGANMTPRASYRHMQMVAQNFSGAYLNGKSSMSNIITFGSVDGNKYSVMIMNRLSSAISYNLLLNYDNTPSGNGTISLNIDADSDLSISHTLAAQATQTLVFENGKITSTVYTENDFDNERPPTITEL